MFDDVKASISLKAVSYLRNSLLELQDDYDLVLIYCMPNFGMMVKNTVFASDYYIIPAKLDYLSMLGIENLERNVKKFLLECGKYAAILNKTNYEPLTLSLLGVVPMMVNIMKGDEPITVQKEYMKEMQDKGFHIFHYVRNNSSLFASSPKEGIPSVLTHPRFSLSAKRIVKELQELGQEFLNSIEE